MTKKITSETKRWTDWDLNDVYDRGYKRGIEAERKRILEIIGKAIHHNQDYCELCENYRELQQAITQEKN